MWKKLLQIVVFRPMCMETLLDPLVHNYKVAFFCTVS